MSDDTKQLDYLQLGQQYEAGFSQKDCTEGGTEAIRRERNLNGRNEQKWRHI